MASLFALWLWFSGSTSPHGSYDDSFITYRYARNLSLGHGLVYNLGQHVDSASSLLWVAILALAYRLGLTDLPTVAWVLGMLCGALTLAVAAGLAFVLDIPRRVAVPMVCLVCLSGPWLMWSASGMETDLWALCCYATLLAAALEMKYNRSPVISTSLGVLAFLARYEGVLLIVVLLAVRLLWDWKAGRGMRMALLYTSGAVSVLMIFVVGKWLYYGSPIPHALSFKAAEPYYQQPRYPLLFILSAFPLVGGMLGLFALRRWTATTATWTLLLTWFGLSIISVKLGPFSDLNRYAVHLLPAAAIIAAGGMTAAWRTSSRRVKVGLCGVVGLLALLQTAESLVGMKEAREMAVAVREDASARQIIGEQLAADKTRGWVFSGDAGAIGWYSNRQILDGVGLVSDGVQKAERNGTSRELFNSYRPALVADSAVSVPGHGWETNGEIHMRLDFASDRELSVQPLVQENTPEHFRAVIWRLHWR